jgi:Polysaccharide pyruvyl transferase
VTKPKAILLNDTTSFNHHGCHLVVEQIRNNCLRHGLDLWHTVKLREDWQAPPHRARLLESDIVLVNGEGTLSNNRSMALNLVRSAAFCRERDIPCVLINSVYQDNGKEIADLVRQFDLVFVRESLSQIELGQAGINSEVVPDMTLSHADLPSVTRTGVLVTDSSSDSAAAQLEQFFTRTDGAEPATLFTPLATSEALRKLVVRVIGKRTTKRWGLDWHRVGRMRNPVFDTAAVGSVHDLFRRVCSKSLIVTGRFHMVCMAMLARTPFVALPGNTHKTEGMLADAGLLHRFRSSAPNAPDLQAWSEWREEEVATVEAYLEEARGRISRMFSRIARVVAVVLLAIQPLLDACDLIML